MNDVTTVTVRILDKDYQINCPPEEVDALKRSADHLDSRMREIKIASNVIGLDRIAVMAALNIANDYIQQGDASAQATQSDADRVDALDGKLEQAINRLRAVT